jgi:oligogalacturonide lyase
MCHAIRHLPSSLLVLVLLTLPALADDPPTQWVDAATGHRVTRLSREAGSSSFYFHQNGYPAGGDTLVISTPSGLSAINLNTGEIRQVVEGRAGQVVVGRKTRQVYYLRGQGVFTTNIDTRETRKIGDLPFRSDSGLTVNADETLLAGSCQDQSGQAARSTLTDADRASLEREGRLGARLARQSPMMLYTIDTKTGEVKTFNHCTDWLNHVQFSPTDPGLLMFAHEGPWHRVDRPWVIRTDGTGLRLVHKRSMPMEISGHEFWSSDGKTVWFDLQTPKSKVFWLAGQNLVSGELTKYPLTAPEWSVHYNISPDGKLFAGDGGGPSSVAAPNNGQWIYLFTPTADGKLKSEKLVDLSKHKYTLEPNLTFTPDGKRIVFRSNMFGPTHVFAVEIAKP